jgi:hypothetical protein
MSRLTYRVFCSDPHALLYQLSDGRFQIMLGMR